MRLRFRIDCKYRVVEVYVNKSFIITISTNRALEVATKRIQVGLELCPNKTPPLDDASLTSVVVVVVNFKSCSNKFVPDL